MSIHNLKPWTELVKLHPDVEDGKLTEAVFAIDLGAIAVRDPNVPVVNRDPDEFFRATYPTVDMRRMLEEVLASLAGKTGYNRVLKLRTAFGGGKSHMLAALLHAARSRKSLNHIAECRDYPDPGQVDVAVFDGEKFTATGGKDVGGGRTVNTMWGWLAWQIGEKAFKVIEKHDQDRVSPSGDEIKAMLTANGRPVLILLDEVLKYMERAGAVSVQDSTLRRLAMDFFQNLTVEVVNSRNAALVFSLQWSGKEAFQNRVLLDELDNYAKRVDQLREPVSGDEVLPILQRRLLGGDPEPAVATEVAQAYQTVITGMQRAEAEGESARRQAEEDGLLLLDRMKRAYPFHPALIDAMKERWTSIDGFQRTRGALRFLASCLHALKKNGGAKPLLGAGDIPLRDVDVRMKMLKELGAQNDFDPVITADLDGPNARAKRIDDRLARETPQLAGIRPATRLATAIFVLGYMPLDFAYKTRAEQEQAARDIFSNYGDRPRSYRNGIGLAIPDKKQVEALRRAARYLLAVAHVESKAKVLKLTPEQVEQLRERKRTETAAAESSLRALYVAVWLPRMQAGRIEIDPVEVGGRPLQATGVHERMWELLSHMTKKVFTSTTPRKISELLRLGQADAGGGAPRQGVRTADVRDAFFGSLGFTRLDSAAALQKAIARGIAEREFAYVSGPTPALGPDGKYQVNAERVVQEGAIGEDEIDLDTGFLMVPAAVPATPPPPTAPAGPGVSTGGVEPPPAPPTTGPVPPTPTTAAPKLVQLTFTATRDQVFKAFPAIANLADKADDGKIQINVGASAADGFDPAWLRNAVYEPLDEANIERQ